MCASFPRLPLSCLISLLSLLFLHFFLCSLSLAPNFYFSLILVLSISPQPEVALVAFSEAVKRSSNKPGWERELAHAQRKAAAKACLSSGPQEESSLRVEPTLLQPAQ